MECIPYSLCVKVVMGVNERHETHVVWSEVFQQIVDNTSQ